MLLIFVSVLLIPGSHFIEGASLGEQLTTVFRKLLIKNPSTRDICVLHDKTKNTHSWNDFLEEFTAEMFSQESGFAVTHEFSPRKCGLYLICLDALSSPAFYVYRFLEAKRWNRYAIVVFVSSIDEEDKQLYRSLAYNLGIIYSVHVKIVGNMSSVQIYDYFRNHIFLPGNVTEVRWYFEKDQLSNIMGYQFGVLLFYKIPFVMLANDGIYGPHVKLVRTFVRHVNATMKFHFSPSKNVNVTQIAHSFVYKTLSMFNILMIVPLYSESMIARSQDGYCFMVPEVLIGSFINHLLRPFMNVLWIAIGFFGIVIFLISYKFTNIFPRGIIQQIFYGDLVAGHEMMLIERFTLFSLGIIVFMLSNAYLAKLFQMVLEVEYLPHLENIEEIAATDLTIYCHTIGIALLLTQFYPNLKNQIQIISNDTIGNLKTNVLFEQCSYAQMHMVSIENFFPGTRIKRYYLLPQTVSVWDEVYTHSRLQPFGKRFEKVYNKMDEAGLLNFWMTQAKNKWRYFPHAVIKIIDEDHLFSLWKLLAGGFGASLFAFAAELIWKVATGYYKVGKHLA